MHIIVIGSGFGGLSAACYLAKAGHKVTILEKNNTLGGRARVFKKNGFTFDMGPSWYLMPEVFDHFFADMDHKITYKVKKLSPSYRIFFQDKTHIDIPSSLPEAKKIFADLEKEGDKKFQHWLDKAQLQYEIGMKEFVSKNYDSIFDFFTWSALSQGMKMNIFQSLDSYAKKMFDNPKSRQILLYTTVFLGSSPKNTPAMYSLMSHVDFNQGVFWVKGGIARVVEEFVTVAKKLGVSIVTNADVLRVQTVNNNITCVKTKTKTYTCDLVVSNADYAHFEQHVLTKKQRFYDSTYWKKKTLAPSGFILYLGVNKKIAKLKHHTLMFNEWEQHFEEIFTNPSWPTSPSYYVCTPSKSDTSVAPKGKENLFILIPMAYGITDTPTARKKMRNWVIQHLETLVGSFEKDIIYERSFALKDFEKDYHAFKGTALGLAHTLDQTALFRPKNHSPKIKNLFYTGHYTVPGVGMPMAIISGKLASERITKKHIQKGK